MAKYSEDYIAGWQAARAQYQHTGGVQPYPSGYAANPMGSVGQPIPLGIDDSVHETKAQDPSVPKKPTRPKKA